jgi:hypothetical protein
MKLNLKFQQDSTGSLIYTYKYNIPVSHDHSSDSSEFPLVTITTIKHKAIKLRTKN